MEGQIQFQDLRDRMMQLYTQGDYASALELVDRHASDLPERFGPIAFWRMCLLSLCGRADEVISTFRRALDRGVWWQESAFLDTDLDAVRDLPEFKRLAALSQERYLQARGTIKPERRLLMPDEMAGPLPLLIALHGRNANADTDLDRWDAARRAGWLVLAPRSTQPVSSDYGFCWDDLQQGLVDIGFHYSEIARDYEIDLRRVVVTGFSQGSGMALVSALSGKIPARGFIGVGTAWRNVGEISTMAAGRPDLRAYFVSGDQDPSLGRAREIQAALREHHIAVAEEVHAGLRHEFPQDFAGSFRKAIAFILEEAE